MADLSWVPTANACLNGAATTLLIAGRVLVRRGRVDAHRRAMLSAFAVSSVFLLLYVSHKAWRNFENTPFHGEGLARAAYLAILISHLVLAIAVPFLAIALVYFGLRGRIASHRRLARVTWPIWLYVSLTGIAVYLFLYPLNPLPA